MVGYLNTYKRITKCVYAFDIWKSKLNQALVVQHVLKVA